MYITPFVAQAAEKKKDGFDFTEAWGVTIASAVTVLGMILAAWIAYQAGRRQVADQGLIEHRHWRRQNRLEAYKQFMVATDNFTEVMDKWRTTRNATNVGRALEALVAAEAGIKLSGPQGLHPHADRVTKAAGAFYQALRRPTLMPALVPPQQWVRLSRDIIDAQNAFVVEAAKVLDNPDL
ncbi:hypothetical protein ACGFZC_00865 [[Kitasatospora] papulosa]|uniref:hypothetical protein n=1 Tax=[Kitasatospora] papulosa TaxID=1464011 RepID=UPI0037191208